jgi:hypothetical protein
MAACLRASGDATAAAAGLLAGIRSGARWSSSLWALWADISFVDLKRSPAQMLQEIPKDLSGYAADLRWLLDRLDAGEPIRIDCGGEGFSGSGAVWGKDRFFEGGNAGGFPALPIDDTDEDGLYRTERWFPEAGTIRGAYRIPLPPARYAVTLHFAEVWFQARELRRFGVSIEGDEVLVNFEPLGHGFAAAQRESFTVEATDGTLDIEFHREVQDPHASGIEVDAVK